MLEKGVTSQRFPKLLPRSIVLQNARHEGLLSLRRGPAPFQKISQWKLRLVLLAEETASPKGFHGRHDLVDLSLEFGRNDLFGHGSLQGLFQHTPRSEEEHGQVRGLTLAERTIEGSRRNVCFLAVPVRQHQEHNVQCGYLCLTRQEPHGFGRFLFLYVGETLVLQQRGDFCHVSLKFGWSWALPSFHDQVHRLHCFGVENGVRDCECGSFVVSW